MSDFLRTYAETPLDGKYKILERLGSGGMGDVYKAEHVYLGAIRVIKVIRPQISGSADAHERFLREARAATRVQHPNVAVLYDFAALPDGSHYMVWEYIDGENLAQRIRARGTLPPREAIRIAIQTLNGLEAIHRAGIIHRDIGPENLMIARDTNMVKIIDLGVAKIDDPDVAVTRTGIFVGKLRYAAPEQLGFLPENERIDARADLYSLGMTLYEMLVGRPPFEGKSPVDYFRHHSDETAMQLVDLDRDLPGHDALKAILRRALQRSRNKRFQNAAEFRAALEQVEATVDTVPATTVRTEVGPAPRSRSNMLPLLVVVLVVALASIAATVWFMHRPEPVGEPAHTTVSVVPEQTTTTTVPPARADEAVGAPPSTKSETEAAPEPEPQPQPVITPKPRNLETPQPKPAPVEEPVLATYTEGGDRHVNGSLLDQLRSQLAGVNKIALDAGPMQDELTKALTHEIPTLAIVDSAPVSVHFNGTFERLGRGRKRRAAQATVTKNGHVIFRYEMPSEEYRVGATPVEAFTDLLANALPR
ncbi:MAG TPA: protein kinase [Thermoanaerobaculia bacterium]|nr:protein kinase [Thermoanaerobaculia bacterium]